MSMIRDQIHTDIPSQFPSIYREDDGLFVSFVESYYEYIDSQTNNYRDAYAIRDIDSTYERFLIYFRNKYAADLPLQDDQNFRFILKHIHDLYRRKGTEESLRLFFQMFFDEEIEVVYPGFNILRPSDSIYGSNFYIEMDPVTSIKNYPIRRGDFIKGDTSKATGFVDTIVFFNFSGVITPIVYLSNLYGRFVSDDDLIISSTTINDSGFSEETTVNVDASVFGSISSVQVSNRGRLAGNRVGDILTIRSSRNGVDGKAIVEQVADETTGVVDFQIEDSGYGYSANNQNNQIYISTQTLVLNAEDPVSGIEDFANVSVSNNQVVGANTSGLYFDGSGEVVRYNHPLLYVRSIANNQFTVTDTTANTSSYDLPMNTNATINVEGVGEVEIDRLSPYNNTANFTIDELKNTEQVLIITDIIGDYANVSLNSSDYQMSSSGQQTINTVIRDAFEPKQFTIGEIDSLTVLDEGIGYETDVAVNVKQPEISRFDIRDVGVIFKNPTFLLSQGDIVTQTIQIEDLSSTSSEIEYIDYTVRARFVRREDDVFYFKYISFYRFDDDAPITITNNQYQVEALLADNDSRSMGENGEIIGESYFASGQVEAVSVINTGFRYEDGETVDLLNDQGVVVATATIFTRGMGFTEGSWKTSTSFLSDSTRVLRDNLYYQEYSYDVSSIINPELYTDLTRSLIQVAGTKQFDSPLINSSSNVGVDVDVSFEVYNLTTEDFETESGQALVTESGEQLVAVVSSLDQQTSNTVNSTI